MLKLMGKKILTILGSTIVFILTHLVYHCRNVAGMFVKEDFEALGPVVDRFSLMTYDFSNPSR